MSKVLSDHRLQWALALFLTWTAPSSEARPLYSGTVSHPGGNFCTIKTLVVFKSEGGDVYVSAQSAAPYITLSPSARVTNYSCFGGFYTCQNYWSLVPGQTYTLRFSLCGPNGLSAPVTVTESDLERVYWVERSPKRIRTAVKDGTSVESLISTGLIEPVGLALDASSGKVYWADRGSGKLQRANFDGFGVQDLATGLAGVEGLALDITGGKVYWYTGGAGGKIQRANLDGTSPQTLVSTGFNGLNGIAVDHAHGKMYWTDTELRGICRASLLGDSVQTVVPGLSFPGGIALDLDEGKMYWTDSGIRAHNISRANLDGTQTAPLVTGLGSPRCITLDLAAHKMYWTDSQSGKVQRASLNGLAVEDVVDSLSSPWGIAVVRQTGDWTGIEPATAPRPPVILETPRPNPFNPTTTISFVHPGGPLTLKVYDVGGMLVRTLLEGELAPGRDTRVWDGRDDRGAAVPTGLYFLRLRSDGQEQVAKAILLK